MGSLYRQKRNRHSNRHILKVSVNGASMVFGPVSKSIGMPFARWYLWTTYWQPWWAKEKATWSHPKSENERQQSVNNFGCCILYNPRAVIQHLSILGVLAAFIGNIVCVETATPQTERQQSVNRLLTEHQHSVNGLSTECQRFWVLNHVKSKCSPITCTHNQRIGIRSGQKRSRNGHCPGLRMSVNRVSTILWVASCVIQTLCYGIYP